MASGATQPHDVCELILQSNAAVDDAWGTTIHHYSRLLRIGPRILLRSKEAPLVRCITLSHHHAFSD